MIDIINEYDKHCERRSDIHEHLPTLKKYAERCKHITEMGVRAVVSTWAFLAGKPKKMVCLDINYPTHTDNLTQEPKIQMASRLAKKNGIEFEFIKGDSRLVDLEPTDLLFIDTDHTYKCLSEELKVQGNKASKYIIMHDTSKGGLDYTIMNKLTRGDAMFKAIEEFIEENPKWILKERFTNNYGLTVLERV
jgi:cephalosporin hydroxylase